MHFLQEKAFFSGGLRIMNGSLFSDECLKGISEDLLKYSCNSKMTLKAKTCYTGVDQILTKYEGDSTQHSRCHAIS